MSAENVDIIREAIDAFNASGDWEVLYAACDPGVVLEIATQEGRESADFRVHHGLAEVRQAISELMAPFVEVRAVAHRYADAGDDRVVAVLELLMRPKESRAEVSSGQFAYIYTLRGGRIIRIQDFPEPAEAFEAAGLTT
jgi:ketosteroid isomerase-like protein